MRQIYNSAPLNRRSEFSWSVQIIEDGASHYFTVEEVNKSVTYAKIYNDWLATQLPAKALRKYFSILRREFSEIQICSLVEILNTIRRDEEQWNLYLSDSLPSRADVPSFRHLAHVEFYDKPELYFVSNSFSQASPHVTAVSSPISCVKYTCKHQDKTKTTTFPYMVEVEGHIFPKKEGVKHYYTVEDINQHATLAKAYNDHLADLWSCLYSKNAPEWLCEYRKALKITSPFDQVDKQFGAIEQVISTDVKASCIYWQERYIDNPSLISTINKTLLEKTGNATETKWMVVFDRLKQYKPVVFSHLNHKPFQWFHTTSHPAYKYARHVVDEKDVRDQYTNFEYVVQLNGDPNLWLTVETINNMTCGNIATQYNEWLATEMSPQEAVQYFKTLNQHISPYRDKYKALEDVIMKDEEAIYQYVHDCLERKESRFTVPPKMRPIHAKIDERKAAANKSSTLPDDLTQLIKKQEKTQGDLVEAMKAGSQVVFACYKHKDFNVIDPHWTSVGLHDAVLSNVIHRFAPCEPPKGFPDLKFIRKYVPLKYCTGIAAYTAFDFLVEVSFGEDQLTHLKNKVYLTVEQVNLNKYITKQFNDWYQYRQTKYWYTPPHARAALREYRTKLHMNPVVDGQFSALEDCIQEDDQDTHQYVCDRLSQGTPPSLISVDMYQTYSKVMSEKIKQKHAIADKLQEMKLDIIKSGVRGDSCATQVKLPATTCDLPDAWRIDKQPEEPQKLYPAIVCRPPKKPKPTPAPEVNYQEDRKRFAGITLATPAFLLFFVTIGNIVSMTISKVDFPSTASCITSVLTHALWLFVSLFLFGRYLIVTKGDTESNGPR